MKIPAGVTLDELAAKGVNMDFINAAIAASDTRVAKLPHADETPAPKPSKHRNTKTEIDGHTFDSKKEALHWLDLRAEQADGRITQLRRQVAFPIVVNDVEICTYVADFVYVRGGAEVIEDVKSKHTRKLPDYRIKKKLMEAMGKPIKEVL